MIASIILALGQDTTKNSAFIVLGLLGLLILGAIAMLVIGLIKRHRDENDELPDFFTEIEEVEEIVEEDVSSAFSMDEDVIFDDDNEAAELMKGVQLASRAAVKEQSAEKGKFKFFKKS